MRNLQTKTKTKSALENVPNGCFAAVASSVAQWHSSFNMTKSKDDLWILYVYKAAMITADKLGNLFRHNFEC